MKYVGSLGWVVLALALSMAVRGAATETRPLEFLHGLQEKEFDEMALEYMNALAAQPGGAPAEVKDVWDLELSKCYRVSAKGAFVDAKEFDHLMGEAQKCLDKFLKEHPTHPEAATASFSWASFAVDNALQHMKAAQAATDPKQQAELYAEARKCLQDAKPRFAQALPKFLARVKALPPLPTKGKTAQEQRLLAQRLAQRDQVEGDFFNALFQSALCDFYVSQTYPDVKDSHRIAALKQASQAFDDIHQRNRVNARGEVNPVGLFAHMWNGRCAQLLGDLQTAEDIYDEVLANIPDNSKDSLQELDSLFAQVEYFRLQIVKGKDKTLKKYLAEASEWVTTYKNLAPTDGYQGICLELVKTELAAAEKTSSASARQNMIRFAHDLLKSMVTVHSSYQREAILMRRTITKSDATDVNKVEKFSEALALADTAVQSEQWIEALSGYQRALALSAQERDKTLVAKVHDKLSQVQLRLAANLFAEDKLEECIAMAGQVVKENPASTVAPDATLLAIQAAFNRYVAAPAEKRNAELARLVNLASFAIRKWPDRPEAEEARLSLGRASLAQGQVDQALETFEQINPKSKRYASALQLAGRTLWWRYLVERQKMGQKAPYNAAQMEADRKKAVDKLTRSYDLQTKSAEPGKSGGRDLQETMLALAEIRAEENHPEEAAKLYQTLVDGIKANKEPLSATTLQVCMGAAKAYLAINDLDKAFEVGSMLIDSGPDTPQVNGILLRCAVTLNNQRKKVQAEADAGDEKKKASLDALNKKLGEMIGKLASRKQQTLKGMVYIGDTLMAVGLTEESEQEYQQIEERMRDDSAFANGEKNVMNRVRSQLAAINRKKAEQAGDDEEARKLYFSALAQAKALLDATGNKALEPWMEMGRILQSRAKRFKDVQGYQDSVKHWTKLQSMLERVLVKGKHPPEFFEVTYSLAECLSKVGNGTKGSNPKKAREEWSTAEKLLKGTLIMNPKLSGEDMVVRYNTLLQELAGKLGHAFEDSSAPAADKAGTKSGAKPATSPPSAAASGKPNPGSRLAGSGSPSGKGGGK